MAIEYRLGDPEDYNPVTLARMPEDELRAEYARLRKTANERLRRIEKSSDFGDSAIVRNNKDWLSTPASKVSAEDLPLALSRVESLLEAKTGTLTGLRQARAKTLESLKASGIKGINKSNYGAFTSFMKKTQAFREAYIPYPKRAKGSERRDAARQIRPRMFKLTEQGNISESAVMKEFQFFRDNLDKIEQLARSGALNPDRKRSYSANEIRKMLGMAPEPSRTVKEAKAEAGAAAPERTSRRRRK